MKTEFIVLNQERNVTLTAYLLQTDGEFAKVAKRPAMLILPGGGYAMCSDREADPVAWPYLKAGFQVFILRYSVQKSAVWPNPLNDYEQAMELIRSRAGEWNLYPDKIGVVGFSAGGHLAGCAAVMSRNRPNAAVLGYAVLGADVKLCNPSAPDVIEAVDNNTCPCFVFAARNDSVVPIDNSTRFLTALADKGVAFESHIYGYGPHGFSTADSSVQMGDGICSRAARWVEDSIAWLKEIFGDFQEGGLGQPKCGIRVNDDNLPYYTVDCSFGHLNSNPFVMTVLAPVMDSVQKRTAQQVGDNPKMSGDGGLDRDMAAMVKNMTLRDMLSLGKAPQELVETLDAQLRSIPNSESTGSINPRF